MEMLMVFQFKIHEKYSTLQGFIFNCVAAFFEQRQYYYISTPDFS